MNATANALSELRKQIEANKRLLEEQERALTVLEKMMGQSSGVVIIPDNDQASPSNLPSGGINLGELDVAENGDRQSLREQVCEFIRRFGDQEFTSAHIFAALKKAGIVVNGKYPRSRISMVLSKLEDEGALKRTFTGGGNVPHRYQSSFVAKELA